VGDSFSAYLLARLFAEPERNLERNATKILGAKVRERLGEHPQWDTGIGWKTWLNNLRLISLLLCFNLILPWLKVFLFHNYPWEGLLL